MQLVHVTLLLSVFATTLAFNTLTPQNKNTIYKWNAVIKASTNLPQFASQFVLQGQIHLQSDSNSTIVQIKNLTYQLYNGVLNHDAENQAQDLPLPPELSELENIFKIIYTEDGLVTGILTQPKEKLFPLNLKKALATILQLNNSVVSRTYNYPETFVRKEKSIYGHGNVQYSIFPLDDGVLEVRKSHDMSNPNHLYAFYATNTNTASCDTKYEHMLMHDSTKKYYIKKENDQHLVTKIHSVGTVVYYPFGAKSEAQFVEVNQKFEFLEVTSTETEQYFDSGEFETNLSYLPFPDDDGRINGITKDQLKSKVRKIFPEVQSMLKDIPRYLKEDHIHSKEPDIKRGQTINHLQRLLIQFDMEDLEELRKSLSDEALNAFYHVLPIIGTKASVIYIKNLIVDKIVDDATAVDLLQHIHEILGPFVYPIKDLEELSTLNYTYSWELRKVAILSFGSIIYKRYTYDKVLHPQTESRELQEPYKKYIEQYFNQLKGAKEYKVKMTYLLALRNMKLSILLEYLVPPFNDKEIFDNHNLHLVGLWAVAPFIISSSDPDLIMETLWPIITNPQERSEIRISAYWYFMKSKPTHSRLRNLHFYMLREKDSEFYKFHYNYLKESIQSSNICNDELRIQAAQLMKFTPPPTSGVSSISFASYRDVDYGFGLETESYLISCNTSTVYALALNTYHFNRIQNDYVLFLRVNDNRKGRGGFLTNTIFEGLIMALFGNAFSNRVTFMEGVIWKRDQVINTYYFDHKDYEYFTLFGFFFASNQFFTKNYIHIYYEWFHRVLLPTDLGIPVIWEFLMPNVEDHSIFLERNHSQSKTQIHYRYTNWKHYSHGVGFYNPVVDIWQGVHRFHAYDAVLPINIKLGRISEGIKLTWKKQDNGVLNTAGVRTHVKRAVFIYDDYKYNVLNLSSPNAKEFRVVTNGKRYRHDYNLVDYDDLNSGHKWFLSIYDSNKDISNGFFKHKISLFAQSQTKHYSSILEYIFLTLHHGLHFSLLTPDPGIYGFIFKVEPSHKYNISSIDFTISGNDGDRTEKGVYMPGVSWSPNITYTINNGDQILKQWILNATLEVSKGHTLLSNKFVLTQQPENQTIRFERLKKWSAKKVSSYINVFADDDNIITIESKGQRSLEQVDGSNKYGQCEYPVPYFKKHYYTMDCILAHNTLRHYVYDIKTKNIPSEWQNSFNHLWTFLTAYYQTYFTCNNERNKNISDSEIQIEVDFPIQTRVLDFHVTTSEHVYELSGIPRDHWIWFGLTPDFLSFSVDFYESYKRGSVDRCLIYPDYYIINEKLNSKKILDTWTPYFGNSDWDSYVYFKTLPNNKLAVKVTDNYNQNNHTIEIIPNEDNYKLILDEKEVSIEEAEYNGEWIYYYIFKDDPGKFSVFLFKSYGIHLGYDLEKVTIISNEKIFRSGVCFENNTTV